MAQQRNIQLRSVKATLAADMDLHGILGADPEVRNGFSGVRVDYDIDADASPEDIQALVAQSQKRSAVYDILTNPTDVTVNVSVTDPAVTTVVVGAGHSGLAMSRHLSALGDRPRRARAGPGGRVVAQPAVGLVAAADAQLDDPAARRGLRR